VAHCSAHWRKYGKTISAAHKKTIRAPNLLPHSRASSSKAVNFQPEIDLLPSSANRDSSFSLNIEIQLAFKQQTPSGPPAILYKAICFSPVIPALANPSIMAYQRADPSPFTSNGFHAIEV
jgi:hypothetical protein